MNNLLRKIAIAVGVFLLVVSIFWSQDGFNFSLAGDSGGGGVALFVGWGLAISVSAVQFVFSTNYRELNASLITFGVLAYIYSIYTNYQGILHFQGVAANKFGAGILGFVMDGVPEPLIAWGLRESLSGDFIGNLIKAAFGSNKTDQTPQRLPQHSQRPAQKPHRETHRPQHLNALPRRFEQNEQDKEGEEGGEAEPLFSQPLFRVNEAAKQNSKRTPQTPSWK